MMLRIDVKRWIKDRWYAQRWFGYTYLRVSLGGGGFSAGTYSADWSDDEDVVGCWYKNDHQLVKLFNKVGNYETNI